MNPIVNLNLILEKELELERQGLLRRTRRWVGDVDQVADARWYRGGVRPRSAVEHSRDEISCYVEAEPRREARRSLLGRLFHRPRARRQTASNKC